MLQNTMHQVPSIESKEIYDDNNNNNCTGVAVTLMLRAPKWFHRRYTVMVQNVMANIPPSWCIQIIANMAWLQHDVIPLHPGLERLLFPNSNLSTTTMIRQHPRVILTPLPKPMIPWKPKQIYKSMWFWESIVAEQIFLFSGNGALCANHDKSVRWEQFMEYDYVGIPWHAYDGIGGDGSTHSLRHKSAMIQILRDHPLPTSLEDPNNDPDYTYFVRAMHAEPMRYKLATRAVTEQFGGVLVSSSQKRNDHLPEASLMFPPLVVSGTLAQLNWTARESLLLVCPELKLIFPSLHEPSCFGAHPNGAKCKQTICALQDVLPKSGC